MLSNHFDGKRYFNQERSSYSLWRVLYWLGMRSPPAWPNIQVKQQKILQSRTQAGECSVTFINHSTVLIQLEGWNILTDPIWSERASPFTWIGPKRCGLPGVKFEDLPPIDIVLISHNHYDHMDIPTLQALWRKHQPKFFVSKGDKKFLESKGIMQVQELDWWDEIPLSSSYTLHFVPAKHFSSRFFLDYNCTLWGGFVIKGTKYTLYFAGDTGFGPHFAQIRKRLGSPTLSFLPIGAYEPRWLMKDRHLSPQEAVEAHLVLGSKQSMGIHFGTFPLADESFDAPLQNLHQALEAHGLSFDSFWTLLPGESKRVSEVNNNLI